MSILYLRCQANLYQLQDWNSTWDYTVCTHESGPRVKCWTSYPRKCFDFVWFESEFGDIIFRDGWCTSTQFRMFLICQVKMMEGQPPGKGGHHVEPCWDPCIFLGHVRVLWKHVVVSHETHTVPVSYIGAYRSHVVEYLPLLRNISCVVLLGNLNLHCYRKLTRFALLFLVDCSCSASRCTNSMSLLQAVVAVATVTLFPSHPQKHIEIM